VTNPVTGTLETIGIPDDEWGSRGIQPGWKKKIAEYFSSLHPRACYVYDPGDDWEHDVVYEKTLPRDDREFYPRCIAGRRSTPPEDCGGPWGYANLLKVLEDPSDEQYEEALEWAGDAFDPECFNKNEILFSDPRKRLEPCFPDDGETDRTEKRPRKRNGRNFPCRPGWSCGKKRPKRGKHPSEPGSGKSPGSWKNTRKSSPRPWKSADESVRRRGHRPPVPRSDPHDGGGPDRKRETPGSPPFL
jgi:hypothetical protein